MVTLALISITGATEGALASAYRSAGEPLLLFSTRELDFVGEHRGEVPAWLSNASLGPGPFQVGRYLEQLVIELGVTTVLSVGREASWFAAKHLADTSYTAVLLRGDVDLSSRRPAQVGMFQLISSTTTRLVLEDQWEMGKAAAHGSRVPHHRLPLLSSGGDPVLTSIGTRVAILYGGRVASHGSLLTGLLAACRRRRVPCDAVSMASLFRNRDLERGISLDQALRFRLGAFTHVVVLGDHRDTAAVVATLAREPGRVIVEGTLASTALVDRLEGVVGARGTAIIDRLNRVLSAWRAERGTAATTAVRQLQRAGRLPGVPGRLARRGHRILDRMAVQRYRRLEVKSTSDAHLPSWFAALGERDVPWFQEDLWEDREGPGHFDVFFTVAPVENRANGARPQRVRNVAETMCARGPTIVLQPLDRLLDRRAQLVGHLVKNGWSPRMVYGENSTSPMDSISTIDRVARLFRSLGEKGALRAWFVRDLHWLSRETVRGYSPSPDLVDRGLYELRTMASVTELFLAPNEGSRTEFQELLSNHDVDTAHWSVLPPALHPDNVCNIESLAKKVPGLTLLYAGGTNGFYRQDVFLSAIAELSKERGFHLDLVVRDAEAEHLAESLQRASLAPRRTVRVITEDLSRYVPLTPNVLGVALLDGRYATRAFPYKTVSMLERGLHVLCFEDMAIAGFLDKYDAGVFCDRDVASVVDAARRYRDRHDRIDVSALMANESWTARIDDLWSTMVAAHRSRPTE